MNQNDQKIYSDDNLAIESWKKATLGGGVFDQIQMFIKREELQINGNFGKYTKLVVESSDVFCLTRGLSTEQNRINISNNVMLIIKKKSFFNKADKEATNENE